MTASLCFNDFTLQAQPCNAPAGLRPRHERTVGGGYAHHPRRSQGNAAQALQAHAGHRPGSVHPPAGLRGNSLHPGRADQPRREAATVLPPHARRLALPLHGTGYKT